MFNKAMSVIERYVTAVLFFAMCTIILLQVIFRATHISVAWTEEVARYLFVWIIYLAGSRAVLRDKHLTVDILPIILKGKGKIYINILSTAFTMVFFIVLLYCGSLVIGAMAENPQYSPANHINMMIPYLAPTVGSAMMLLRGAERIGKDVKALKNGAYEKEGAENE